MTDLKPCPNPWCDGESPPNMRRGQITREAPEEIQIECVACNIQGPPCDTKTEAIAAWNDRPADPHCEALAEALTEAKSFIEQRNAELCKAVYQHEEMKNPNAWGGIDNYRFDGDGASMRDMMDAALAAYRSAKTG